MLVSCKENSRKSAHGERNVKVMCQVSLVLFTGPTKTTVPSMCFTNKDKRRGPHMYNIADNNRTGGESDGSGGSTLGAG